MWPDKSVSNFCHSLAVWLHRNQKDNQGVPYIKHLNSVALLLDNERFNDEYIKSAAFLHDAVEDGHITEGQLVALGIPERVIYLVDLLTRKNGVDYFDYIKRLSVDEDAIAIKLCDLRHNQDPSRGPIPEKRRLKYERAQAYLQAVLDHNKMLQDKP